MLSVTKVSRSHLFRHVAGIVDVRATACPVSGRLDDHEIGLETKSGDGAVVGAVAHVGAGEHFGNPTPAVVVGVGHRDVDGVQPGVGHVGAGR